MRATRPVTLTVILPEGIAEQAEELARTEPELLAQMVLYPFMRYGVYAALRDRVRETTTEGARG
jgi:hypothetical protein